MASVSFAVEEERNNSPSPFTTLEKCYARLAFRPVGIEPITPITFSVPLVITQRGSPNSLMGSRRWS